MKRERQLKIFYFLLGMLLGVIGLAIMITIECFFADVLFWSGILKLDLVCVWR